MSDLGFTSKVLHTRYNKEDAHNSLHFPVYDSASFEFDSAEDIADVFQGRKPGHSYSRITNPTVEHLERKVQTITNALSATAVSSGMAAISTFFLTILKSGDNIITSPYLFGNTLSLFESTLKPFGINVKYADLTKAEELGTIIDNNTRAIFFETITNPQLEVVDVKAISKIAREHNITVVSDSTMTPPYIFNAKEHGVDIEIISSTKYISGGATSVGGIVIDYGTYDWSKNPKLVDAKKKFGQFAFTAKYKKEVYRNIGSCLSPHNAYLQIIGIDTLALRLDRSVENTKVVAEWLYENPQIKKVNYPGLSSSPFFEIATKQFNNKPGGLLTFELESQDTCFKLINALKLIRRATNLNDNKSLIIHPASTIFSEYSADKRAEYGVRDNLIRLSIGIEDVQDIIEDLDNALNA